jgi:hypothetical protein
MAIIVVQEKTFSNGLTLTNFVISCRGKLTTFLKIETGDYQIQYGIYYYATQAAYAAGAAPIQSEAKTIILTAGQLDSNIFTHIYNELKTTYPGTVDY